jgi:two-component sensor histidine kinase
MQRLLRTLITPGSDVPINQLRNLSSLPRLLALGMTAVVLLLLFFVLYGIIGIELSPSAPNLVFGYLNLLISIAALTFILTGSAIGGVRLFLLGMLLCIMLQPFFVHPVTLQHSFMVNPLVAVSLLIVAGLFFTRRTLFWMVIAVGAAILAALWVRGDVEVHARLPIVVAALFGVGLALYYWSEIVGRVLRDARAAAREAERRARERDLMLRETHHRIKNNLGIVNALIHMKMQKLPKENSLGDLSRQIRTIMLLHEKLHNQEVGDVHSIRLARHLRDVLDIVFSSSDRNRIQLDIELEEAMEVDPKQAVPIGLIVHELAMNALKYSFTGEEHSRFTISGRPPEEDTEFTLQIAHSGPPLPEDFSFERQDTLGLQLVDALVSQLGGRIELQRSPSPAFSIVFPL